MSVQLVQHLPVVVTVMYLTEIKNQNIKHVTSHKNSIVDLQPKHFVEGHPWAEVRLALTPGYGSSLYFLFVLSWGTVLESPSFVNVCDFQLGA